MMRPKTPIGQAVVGWMSLLGLVGLEVAVAYDGEQAVQHVCAHPVDVVVMDIGMPGMNGYDAARAMRRCLGERRPLLVALTGWGQYRDRAMATEAGFDFHLVKPLVLEDLLACMAAPHRQEDAEAGRPA